MWKNMKSKWWHFASGMTVLYALGGCLTQAQVSNFLRSEVSLVTGGVIGQLYLIMTQGG